MIIPSMEDVLGGKVAGHGRCACLYRLSLGVGECASEVPGSWFETNKPGGAYILLYAGRSSSPGHVACSSASGNRGGEQAGGSPGCKRASGPYQLRRGFRSVAPEKTRALRKLRPDDRVGHLAVCVLVLAGAQEEVPESGRVEAAGTSMRSVSYSGRMVQMWALIHAESLQVLGQSRNVTSRERLCRPYRHPPRKGDLRGTL